MSELRKLREILADEGYIRGPFGSALRRNEMDIEGIPVYEQYHAIEDSRHFRYFVKPKKANELRRFYVRPNDLIISCSGTVGCVSLIKDDDPDGIISQALLILRPNPTIVHPEYLHYFFKTKWGKNSLIEVSSGSVQVNIARRSVVEDILVPIPSLSEQQDIVSIMRSFDDKIDLNRRMNATLEAIARAIFQSWFVDFDPVRAKAEGRQPDGMDAETAALFPDRFEESSLGPIPLGWQVQPFDAQVRIVSGGTPKTSNSQYWNGNIPWFSVKDAPLHSDMFVLSTEKSITQAGIDNSSATLLPVFTSIITARGTVGKTALTCVPMAMNQSCYAVRSLYEECDFYTFFRLRESVHAFQQQTHGTVFDTITRQTFSSIDVISPSVCIAQAYDRVIGEMMLVVRNNLAQSQILRQVRDTLLPRLIGGQIKLADTYTTIEEVL